MKNRKKAREQVIEELVALLDTELPVIVIGTPSIGNVW